MNKLENVSPYLYYIGKISKNYAKFSNKIFKEYNINFGDIAYLYVLIEEDGITQEKIAKKLEYNQATVTRAINRLEKKGFIEKRMDLKDKRKKIIHLTLTGKKTTKTIMLKQESFEVQIMQRFELEEQETLKNGLEKLSKNIEEHLKEIS